VYSCSLATWLKQECPIPQLGRTDQTPETRSKSHLCTGFSNRTRTDILCGERRASENNNSIAAARSSIGATAAR
jgi:hypothetical protein